MASSSSPSDAPLRFSAFADRGAMISPDQIETASATWHDAAQPAAVNAAAWERRHTLTQIMVSVLSTLSVPISQYSKQ
jgi:hypothetical protein